MTSRTCDPPSRVVLLCGPPCAGKSVKARELALELVDQVIDFDEIARELGSPALWLHAEPYRSRAELRMRELLAVLPGQGPGTAYVIRSLPEPRARAIAARAVRAAAVHVLDPGMDECLRRATVDSRRPKGTDEQIRSWYVHYGPWSGDYRG